jgi:site-specific DNA-methyltransferase (adenine-specific)
LVLGRSDYHYQHEPIFYGWKKGAAHTWNSDRKQTTILEFARPKRNADHPTMKPVELVQYCLQNSSNADDLIADPFGGSGTTLIAAETLGRAAALIELDPRYCDVIVRRWEDFTGQKAVRQTAQTEVEQ